MSKDNERPDGVSVHTGFPNPAIDKSLHGLDLNQLLVQHGASTYMFTIRGSDWEEAGIFNGDIAIVDRALDPRKTDVVLWWNEARGEFSISHCSQMPNAAAHWGVITAIIHQLRKRSHE